MIAGAGVGVSVGAALLALAMLPSKSAESVLASFSHLEAVPFEQNFA